MNEDGVRIIQFNLNPNEELVKKINRKTVPHFKMIGDGMATSKTVKSIDFLREIINATKAEQFVIITIKDLLTHKTVDGEVFIKLSDFTQTQQRVFLKGFKLLEKKNLAKRTKQSHYMINPNAIIPINYEEAIEKWNK